MHVGRLLVEAEDGRAPRLPVRGVDGAAEAALQAQAVPGEQQGVALQQVDGGEVGGDGGPHGRRDPGAAVLQRPQVVVLRRLQLLAKVVGRRPGRHDLVVGGGQQLQRQHRVGLGRLVEHGEVGAVEGASVHGWQAVWLLARGRALMRAA